MEDDDVEAVRSTAVDLLNIVRRQARRPFLVELAGTPKAGKTSVIRLVADFFSACGYRVRVLHEQAASCPLSMKGHFFFNTWTTTSMLSELLEVIDTEDDIVILDRGFFDALVWLELQARREQITKEERDVFEQFVRLHRWRSLVDVAVVLTASPATAMQREHAGLLIPRDGTLMNPAALADFNQCLEATMDRAADWFDIAVVPTDDARDARQTALRVMAQVLPKLRSRVDPRIASLPRSVVERLVTAGRAFVPWDAAVWEEICEATTSSVRSSVEDRDDVVQLVACGIATHDGGIFVFERDAKDPRYRAYGAGTIWQGPHVTYDGPEPFSLARVQECLGERFKEDLHLALPPVESPSPIGFVWNAEVGAGHHLGVVIPVEIQSVQTASHLKGKKFRTRGRRLPQASRFVPPAELRASPNDYDLEQWSRAILESGWPPP